ncbi:MAG: hypothetical protein NC483_05220 [Ruminococcus sp.]|nr:hypothetical protein [Ruminococcus sp.]
MKKLIIILGIAWILLVFNFGWYKYTNGVIDKKSRDVITKFLNDYCDNCEFKYSFKKATINEDSSINIFIKIDSEYFKEYYRFIVNKDNGSFIIKEVNQDIPEYIKKSII